MRKSHGTGMGHSSSAGFWIPKKPMVVAPQPRAVASSRKRKSSSANFGRGRPSGGGRGRPSKAATQEVMEEIADSEPAVDQILEPVPVSPKLILTFVANHCLHRVQSFPSPSLQDCYGVYIPRILSRQSGLKLLSHLLQLALNSSSVLLALKL